MKVTYTVHAIHCDHPGCDAEHEGHAGMSAAAVREQGVRRLGWTRAARQDWCPEHSTIPTGGAR